MIYFCLFLLLFCSMGLSDFPVRPRLDLSAGFGDATSLRSACEHGQLLCCSARSRKDIGSMPGVHYDLEQV